LTDSKLLGCREHAALIAFVACPAQSRRARKQSACLINLASSTGGCNNF